MRIAVSDLVGKPGATRGVTTTLEPTAAEDWGALAEALAGPIDLDLHLDSVVEGILVRGQVAADLRQDCARCLDPVRASHDVAVGELYRPAGHEEAEEGYEIADDSIALDVLVRDALAVQLPVAQLCRPDCQGLCPTCGSNRNDGDCGHREEAAPDARWAKLAELKLGDD